MPRIPPPRKAIGEAEAQFLATASARRERARTDGIRLCSQMAQLFGADFSDVKEFSLDLKKPSLRSVVMERGGRGP